MSHPTDEDTAIRTLWDKIKDVRFAMLATAEADGTIRSRPMTTLQGEPSGELWFFTNDPSGKTAEIQEDQHVNLSYAAADKNVYVSISGRARIVRDPAKAKELWNPVLKAWFPDGLDDPTLALLCLSMEQAEYWDGSSSKLVQLAGIVKALATGTEYEQGENEKINVQG
jgi:general stress protein 26